MKNNQWNLTFDQILQDFLRGPETLQRCVDEYYGKYGQNVIIRALDSFKTLDVDRVLFIGNTFNYFASHVPHYCLSLTDAKLDFTWQIFELTEFNNYFMPQEVFTSENQKTLYIFISNSGESNLLVDAVRQLNLLKIDPEYIWMVTKNPHPSVEDKVGFIFQTFVNREMVLGTKSFMATILVLYFISLLIQKRNPLIEKTHEKLVGTINALGNYSSRWEVNSRKIMSFMGENFSFLYIISREPASYSTASVGSLSAMSFTRILAESTTLGLFFHGPFQIMSEDHACIVLIGDKLNQEAKNLLNRLLNKIASKLKGGNVVLVSNDDTFSPENKDLLSINFNSEIDALSPIFEFYILQFVFLLLAKKRGIVA